MSCTVIAVPYALFWVVGTLVTAASAAVVGQNNDNKLVKDSAYNELCSDIHTITEEHFIEKDFETPFMDKNLLLKTLEEHGVADISESENNISGNIDGYTLKFEKREADKPYYLRIQSRLKNGVEEKLNDLNMEYATNVQEDAYLHIIDKLKENNMSIEEEVVEDDNTIILTVNID